MKISVILPCFNGASTIREQMEALCRQSWSDGWEVIVANNGSTDGSMAIVEEYRERLPGLTIVEAYQPPGPRLGAFHSYNVGLKAATGDAFVLCEADDEVGDGWLEAMGNALLKHEFIVASLEYRKLNPAWLLEPPGQGYQETSISRIDCHPYLQFAWGCTFGIRRSVYEKLGEFNSSFSFVFDSDYCWRAQLTGITLHLVPEAVMHYRLRSTLKGLFNQKRNWGEDFTVLLRCYGAPSGKFVGLHSGLEIVGYSLMSLGLFPGALLGFPGLRKRLFDNVANLGWQLGAIKGRSRLLENSVLTFSSSKEGISMVTN